MTEGESEHFGHVIRRLDTPPSDFLKLNRRSLGRLRERVERQLFTLEWILATKQQSQTSASLKISYDVSPGVHANTPSLSPVDREIKRIIWLLEKQRRLENSRFLDYDREETFQGESSPSAVTPSTIGAIYQKLYYRFLARKMLRRTPTIHNRRTFVKLTENETIDADNIADEWVSETCIEKAQRTLQAVGIKMSHTPLTWKERQFIESGTWGRYGCFRPSYLRWSWTVTVVEECESEECPNAEK